MEHTNVMLKGILHKINKATAVPEVSQAKTLVSKWFREISIRIDEEERRVNLFLERSGRQESKF